MIVCWSMLCYACVLCVQILKELPEVEAQLQAKGSGLIRSYTTSLSLYVVGVLRRYHCCLLCECIQVLSWQFNGVCIQRCLLIIISRCLI